MNKQIVLPSELEGEIDGLVSEGVFSSFQAAVEELIRLGLASMRTGHRREIPPGPVPGPEKPIAPDPTRDVLKM